MASIGPQIRPITTLDALKLVAVALMVVDHVGLYLVDNDVWFRVLGRPAAVIFGFLIGYSGATRVPASWVALGIGLTLLEDRLRPGDDDRALDILVSLALTRMVMPWFDRLHDARPMALAPAAVALALVAEPVNRHLEYGTEVTLVALLGAAVRLDRGQRTDRAAIDALVLIASVAMSLGAIRHFQLTGWAAVCCIAVLGLTLLTLSRFTVQPIAPPRPLQPLLRFCGRHTLAIYAGHLVPLVVVAWWLDGGVPLD